MRTVIILAFLAIIAASTAVYGTEPLNVGGDFGIGWINNLPYQPEISDDNNSSGLWDWGGTPRFMKLVNGTLEPVNNNNTTASADYLYPGIPGSSGHSDDPWIEAQLTGRVVTTSLKDMIIEGYLPPNFIVPW